MNTKISKQTNITILTLLEYIKRNIMVKHVSDCVYKLRYQPTTISLFLTESVAERNAWQYNQRCV